MVLLDDIKILIMFGLLDVDLQVFTKCNKLQELTTDEHMITTNRIAKALQGSTMLKVSEDGTKVCRVTPIQIKENVDQCTIYVQNLPPDTDHDWLISVFSKYGTVDYVSIPRYNNRKIKGFAFVEFDTPSHTQECLKVRGVVLVNGCQIYRYIIAYVRDNSYNFHNLATCYNLILYFTGIPKKRMCFAITCIPQ